MKYEVRAKMTSYHYITVEAESEKDAIAKAKEIDGGEFVEKFPMSGSWEILDAIEVYTWALKEINRKNGEEKVIEVIEDKAAAWNKMISLNSERCVGFNGKGYGYGKELGMRGVMYYVDGSDGVVYDLTNLDYKDFVMDYTKENNLQGKGE